MIAAINNRKSLTFYQPAYVTPRTNLSSHYTGGIAANSIGNVNQMTIAETCRFNSNLTRNLNNADIMHLKLKTEYNNSIGVTKTDFISDANGNIVSTKGNMDSSIAKAKVVSKREDLMIAQSGGEPPSKPVRGTYKQLTKDLKDVDLTGLTDDEIKELHKKYFGDTDSHHINDKHTHSSDANNPDNLINVSEEEHYSKYHPNGTREPTEGDKIDRRSIMKKATKKSVFKNELRGIGIAVGIGLGVGFTISFAVSLAQSGVSPESLKLAFINGGKGGLESGIMAGVGYGIGRTIGSIVTKAVTGMLNNIGVKITENITQMFNTAVTGTLTTVAFSTYQFVKLKLSGAATREALMIVGKQALFSITILAVSIAVQAALGVTAGIIVSVSIGIITIVYSVTNVLHQKEFSEKLQVYMIEKMQASVLRSLYRTDRLEYKGV